MIPNLGPGARAPNASPVPPSLLKDDDNVSVNVLSWIVDIKVTKIDLSGHNHLCLIIVSEFCPRLKTTECPTTTYIVYLLVI